ncbi:hypothetical protein ACFYXM_11905 [Streptomyces sp. NPDC002476]|uniref:hypothetical protein n=1 Tax=Streptomyces sp. NPDC002476 TaxID=3364648 RepID=UPI003683D274
MADLRAPRADDATLQQEIDRRMAQQYNPAVRDALQMALVAVVRQADPACLERWFAPYTDAWDIACVLALAIRREALLEAEAKIRVLSTIAEERSGWPGSLDMMAEDADLLRDMTRTVPPTTLPSTEFQVPAPETTREHPAR